MGTTVIINRNARAYFCPPCNRRFGSEHSLLQHCRQTSLHTWCERCREVFEDEQDLDTHLASALAHRLCGDCNRVFKSSNNLKMHSITHVEPDVECVFCSRLFKSISGMMIHLESGACEAEAVDEGDIRRQWYSFVDVVIDDADKLFTEWPLTVRCHCPGKVFSHVSGMLQHIESGACDVDQAVLEDFVAELDGLRG